ncbi:MAG: hypothetical protein ISP82_04065 [Candidatus Poseidoniaceae archaeon]|nr:hypothetical protein [Candidatus Poseidoniaceae archaeon]MBL6896472.1 hypothetical protein [Candidatus Poseidoniaceae archaeon]MDA8546134.1 hypothetical protein [Candidatus Poseidoniales archaeon]MDB4657089.1 hypothetical protein [Candidatus Poseidoniaceae archaeon]|tara:strand:- start:289 stop:615 length:327 start_codon:yes stop_codon:yes gene_type:complete
MKWLSQHMVARYREVILLVGLTLIGIGLILGYQKGTTSASVVFLSFLVLTITVVFWNLFEKTGTNDFNQHSSPGVIEKYTTPNSTDGEINEASVIPNPLDSDIDIPLM